MDEQKRREWDQREQELLKQEREKMRKEMIEAGLRSRYRNAYNWLDGISSEGLKTKTWENFDETRQPKAVEVVRMFAEDLRGTLILQGNFGVGKTHLLAAVCNRLVEHGHTPRFATSPNLFTAIQRVIASHGDYTEILEKAGTCQLLILDDVDKSKWSEFREEVYFAIIDARVTRGLPTALSTNRVSELINFVGGAVASRLSVGQLAVELSGDDYRPLVK